MQRILLLLLILLPSCCWHPHRDGYTHQYAHLRELPTDSLRTEESDYFVIFLVNARHLDYEKSQYFFQTMHKHPDDASKNGDVGHAWIYLQGKKEGTILAIEGGHSGEVGENCPRYLEGVMQRVMARDPNPIAYLWEPLNDGFFQPGAGGHHPTFAAKRDLTEAEFERLWFFVTHEYPFHQYALTGRQCCRFLQETASLLGLDLEVEATLSIEPHLRFLGKRVRLWEDPGFQELTFASPDSLEKSLMVLVGSGEAECALNWYREHFPQTTSSTGPTLADRFRRFTAFR